MDLNVFKVLKVLADFFKPFLKQGAHERDGLFYAFYDTHETVDPEYEDKTPCGNVMLGDEPGNEKAQVKT